MGTFRVLATLTAVIAFAAPLAGCAPEIEVVHLARPNPFVQQRRFAVLAIDYRRLMVGDLPEPAYLAEKDAEKREGFLHDKEAVNANFTNALIDKARQRGIDVVLATGPNDAPFVIRPEVRLLEPGFYAFASKPSEVRMHVLVTAPDGMLLDEIVIAHKTGGSITQPTSRQRLTSDARALGEETADYLARRAGLLVED